MEVTTNYVVFLHHITPAEAEKRLNALASNGIDCYMDEFKRILIHPDQWDSATELLMQTF